MGVAVGIGIDQQSRCSVARNRLGTRCCVGHLFSQEERDPHHQRDHFRHTTPSSAFLTMVDESGQAALVELKDRGLSSLTKVVIQALDQVVAFFKRLQIQLAFYLACIHLSERLHQIGAPWVFPTVAPAERGGTTVPWRVRPVFGASNRGCCGRM